MKKFLQLILLLFLGSTSLFSQTPKKIHDLKSLTDSSGTVHLFYRIYAEYEGTDYYTDNIYHYNTETREEKLLQEDYFDTRFGFPYDVAISDYKFLDNDPQNYVFISTYCDIECSVTISRPDSVDIMGGLFVTMDHLNVEGPDNGRVYVEMGGEVIIGRNGGRDWPDVDAENFDEIPDSSKLGFPLISLSPFNDSLMFGRKYFYSDGESAFLRSIDKGKTSEFLSDTLLPNDIYFDNDSSTIYVIDRLSIPEPDLNCNVNICNYGLFTNTGNAESWKLKKSFPSRVFAPTFPKVFVHPNESGRLYVWTADSVLVSEDYGDDFEVLINPTEGITGFTATPTLEYYTTNSRLYKIEDEKPVELFSIPVSNESEIEFPDHFELLQNYPNPFNPSTTITYRMQMAGEVTIELYTIQGQQVRKLVNDFKPEGQHSFRLNGLDLASGVYIVRGIMGVQTETRKITLIK